MRKIYLILGICLLLSGLFLLIISIKSITGLTIHEGAINGNGKFTGVSFILAGLFSLFLSKKRKKGQAALEFLITYGWAILAAMIALGIIAYFGVFNPDSLVGGSAFLSPPFYINAWQVTSSEIVLEITNSGQETYVLSEGTVTFEGETCTTPQNVLIQPNDRGVITIECAELASRTRIRGDIEIKYQKSSSQLIQSAFGTINEKVISLEGLEDTTYSLIINIVGDGIVTCNGDVCGEVYEVESEVILHAEPGPGYIFSSWGGSCEGAGGDCFLVMDSDMTIEATFVEDGGDGEAEGGLF